MNAVMNNLMDASYVTSTGYVASFLALGNSIRSSLVVPHKFPQLANIFLSLETLIRNRTGVNPTRPSISRTTKLFSVEKDSRANDTSTTPDNSTITTVGWDPSDPITGEINIFTFPAVTCLDVSYTNISTPQAFTDYLYKQIHEQHPLVAELGGSFAQCLGWPDLTDYGVETIYAENYPKKLANQMVVIGVTDDPICPYSGALNTYELLGSDNAIFLVHEGMGHCSSANPNRCTYDVLTSYFVNGTPLLDGLDSVERADQ
jgi:hypothetical protein